MKESISLSMAKREMLDFSSEISDTLTQIVSSMSLEASFLHSSAEPEQAIFAPRGNMRKHYELQRECYQISPCPLRRKKNAPHGDFFSFLIT